MRVEEVLERIDELCEERGWSHYELARKAKMPVSSIYNMFLRTGIPRLDTLEKICDVFEITLGEFFSPVDRRGDLTETEILLVERFRRLPEEERGVLMAYWDGLEAAHKKE